MKEHPILMSTPMVQAILDGRKTQTRRIAKFLGNRNPNWTGYIKDGLQLYNGRNEPCLKEPQYKVGDVLWVRETWRDRWGMAYANYGTGNAYPIDDVREIEYKAGGNGFFMHGCNLCPDEPTVKWGEWSKWRPSIFMPREAARIFLRVTNVRVERLKKITLEDIKKEGIKATGAWDCMDYLDAFAELWDSIYAEPKAVTNKDDGILYYESYPWEDIQETREYKGKPWYVYGNPWVWVYEFEREVER